MFPKRGIILIMLRKPINETINYRNISLNRKFGDGPLSERFKQKNRN